MSYVIKKGRYYVAKPGSKKSYTTVLNHARRFATRHIAEVNACGNETVVEVAE